MQWIFKNTKKKKFCEERIVFFFPPINGAAAKSLQSCPTVCDPIDGSPPASAVPGILQARTLEWLNKWCYPHAKERMWTLISQNTQNWSQNESVLRVRANTINLLQKSINFSDCIRQWFLRHDTKQTQPKFRSSKLKSFLLIKIFCASGNTTKKVKRQPTE